MRRGSEVIETTATLRHELAHLALGAALGDRAPRWLHEGFAYQHSAEWSQERFETLATMAWMGSVIPLKELEGNVDFRTRPVAAEEGVDLCPCQRAPAAKRLQDRVGHRDAEPPLKDAAH